jgi:hypothetical protein
MRDAAIEIIEQALGKLCDSNHRSKEKSIAWERVGRIDLRGCRRRIISSIP